MSIQGLVSPEVVRLPQSIDMSDAAAVTLEALTVLNLVGDDREATLASISESYRALTTQAEELDLAGELYVDVPYDMLATSGLVAAIDNYSQGRYAETYVYRNLWTPTTQDGSYTDAQLAATASITPTARLALFAEDSPNEPLLHFRNQPFDGYAKEQWGGDKTQLASIEEAKELLDIEHPELTMLALGHRAALLIAMQRRIKGEAMPMSWGFMRDGNLPRTTMDGRSVVGSVDSNEDRLRLDRSHGGAYSGGGVGLSVGLNES